MNKKFILGIFLTIIFFLIISLIFFRSDNKNKITQSEVRLIEEDVENSNVIKDVTYNSKDAKGNEYNLKASEGIIDQKESNYIFLTSVNGIIDLKNYNLIEISSEFGKYNVTNYDTIFSKNVIITYLDNTIKGEYLEFSWDKNLMIISRNVTVKNNKSSLKADVIEINIQTQDVKIFMYEENKKVNIKSLN